jgi:hypothetical protein
VSEDMPGTVFLEYVGERRVVRRLGWVQDRMVAAPGLRERKGCVVLPGRREARSGANSTGDDGARAANS